MRRHLVVLWAELGRSQAEQDIAKLGQTVPRGEPCPFQCRSLPLHGHFVVAEIDPPDFMVAQIVRHAAQRHAQRILNPLIYHAAVAGHRSGRFGRENHGAAHSQPGPGERLAGPLGELHKMPAAQTGVLIEHRQPDQAGAGALGVDRRQAGRSFEGLARFRPAFQIQQSRESLEVVLAAAFGDRSARPRPHPPAAEPLAIKRFYQPGLPAVGNLDRGLAGPQSTVSMRRPSSPPDASRNLRMSALVTARGMGERWSVGMNLSRSGVVAVTVVSTTVLRR